MTLLTLLLSGCAGTTATTQSSASTSTIAAVPEPDEKTGSITGVVVDDSVQPVSGALAGLQDASMGDFSTTTDEAGAFTFNKIPPGSYRLIVQKLGFESAGRKVDVAAGEVTEVRFTLTSIPLEEPYTEFFPLKGYWTFAVATLAAVPNTGVANNEHFFSYELKDHWNTTQLELTWKYSNPGQATTPGAWWNNQAVPKGGGSLSVGEVFGKTAPVTVQFTPGMVYRGDGYKGNRAAFPEKAFKHTGYCFPLGLLTDETQPAFDAALSGSRSRGVGMSLSQAFNMYVTVFYYAAPPAGYSGIPDG